MHLFYTVSDKKSLADRNNLFKEVGIPALEQNGFRKRPFQTSWFGEYYSGIQGYMYEFCRIAENGYLESIEVCITSGDRWIKVFLNLFEVLPKLESIAQLKEREGMKFGVPPNSATKLRLRSDDYKGPPLFYMLFMPEHKIGSYCTSAGYEKQLVKLRKLMQSDMENITDFVKKWHKIRQPNVTDWEGNIINFI